MPMAPLHRSMTLTETVAIKKLFGEQAYNIPVSSTKSVMGHAMGGAGAIETIFCIYAVHQGILAPDLELRDGRS
jgi:3-oxoacyl-[acyl-carrier-protein] synthase II